MIMEGFFNKSTLNATKPSLSLVPLCEVCQLYKHCNSPKMKVNGKGTKKVLILGEAPGESEDNRNMPFCGKSGKKLQSILTKVGLDMREDCWIINSVACRPSDKVGFNRTPTDTEINSCRPAVTRTLTELKPEIVIVLGGIAVKSIMGIIWKGENVGKIGRWVGWKIPEQKFNMWVCPNWHPSYLYRQDDPVLEMYFERYLREAVSLKGRPGKTPKPKIDIILNSRSAAKEIRGFIERGKMIAWDLETSHLKPDSKDAKIVCCSISDGEKTIAYMWEGEAVEASEEMIKSDLPKVGQNSKFETRWIRKKLKCRVRNWWFDDMLAAHILDNRSGITGLKFNSFVTFGTVDYDSHIKPYLKADGSNLPNSIGKLDREELLTYCAMDSLLEYQLAVHQMKELGYPFPDEV